MSICTWVVVSVAFEQVDDAPYAEARAQRDNKGLQNIDRFIEKIHIQN